MVFVVLSFSDYDARIERIGTKYTNKITRMVLYSYAGNVSCEIVIQLWRNNFRDSLSLIRWSSIYVINLSLNI